MAITSPNSVNQLIFVMVKCGVLFEVRTGFLNIIEMGFVFKGLRKCSTHLCRRLQAQEKMIKIDVLERKAENNFTL
jgi:hypothetical protein